MVVLQVWAKVDKQNVKTRRNEQKCLPGRQQKGNLGVPPYFSLLSAPEAYLVPKAYLMIQFPMITLNQPQAPGTKTPQKCAWWAGFRPHQVRKHPKNAPGGHVSGLSKRNPPQNSP